MSDISDLDPEDMEAIRARLEALKAEHRALDERLLEMSVAAPGDPFGLRRLKKRKLQLKDAIATLEDMLLPDIIA